MRNNTEVLHWLFETEAFRVSMPEQPFWYTSGKFGPFYINTHFLFGNEKLATELLAAIDEALAFPLALPRLIGKRCMKQYHNSELYSKIIQISVEHVKDLDFDYVSGGERRDFFFSYPVAELLHKEHLTILKNGRCFLSSNQFREIREIKAEELKGRKVLHVADLVTEASSYFRAWLPSLSFVGAEITDSLSIVDRKQGGRESLLDRGITLKSLIQIDEEFFQEAMNLGKINEKQYEQLLSFINDPDKFMKDFLHEHPDFLENEENKDEKTAERVARFRSLKLFEVE